MKQTFFGLFMGVAILATTSGTKAQDISVVKQFAQLELNTFNTTPNKAWVVGQVRPGKDNGGLFVRDSYIDADSGQTVANPSGGSNYVAYNGRFEIKRHLVGAATPSVIPYSWRENPMGRLPRDPKAINSFWAFRGGGWVIAQVDPAQNNRAKFPVIYFLPSQWVEMVQPAVRFYGSNPTLFEAKNAGKNTTLLRRLLFSPNALIAISACQTLSKANKLNTDFVRGPMLRATGVRQAVFVALMTQQESWTDAKYLPRYPVASPSLAKTLVRRLNPAQVRAIKTGLDAGLVSEYDPFQSKKKIPLPGFAPTLSRALYERAKQLKMLR